MLFLYNLAVRTYGFGIAVTSLFHAKAKQRTKAKNANRENLSRLPLKTGKRIWIHAASVGEFEQARPLIDTIMQQHKQSSIVVSFFSPSGYQRFYNYHHAHAVLYLPLDTAANARTFIDNIQPDLAIFSKYDYWYHHFQELKKRHIPIFVISAIFRPQQFFFKPLVGGFFRQMLENAQHIFVQNQASVDLLNTYNIKNCSVAGDTRFDQVIKLSNSEFNDGLIESFIAHHRVIIAGSTWNTDLTLLRAAITSNEILCKWILVPHELQEAQLANTALELGALRYSQLPDSNELTNSKILIVDQIGILSKIYRYADVAYIGGGFGQGIHNILEAAVYCVPVLFGPNNYKFAEAQELKALQTAFEINNQENLISKVKLLLSQDNPEIAQGLKLYFEDKKGATSIIYKAISGYL